MRVSNKLKVVVLVFILLAAGVGTYVVMNYNQAPSEYKNLAKKYLELRELNDSQALDLCYFKPEFAFIKQAIIDSGDRILKAEIKKTEKINDNLWAFHVKYEMTSQIHTKYLFVANINGTLFTIINKRDIPDDLKDNYVESDYELYDDPDAL